LGCLAVLNADKPWFKNGSEKVRIRMNDCHIVMEAPRVLAIAINTPIHSSVELIVHGPHSANHGDGGWRESEVSAASFWKSLKQAVVKQFGTSSTMILKADVNADPDDTEEAKVEIWNAYQEFLEALRLHDICVLPSGQRDKHLTHQSTHGEFRQLDHMAVRGRVALMQESTKVEWYMPKTTKGEFQDHSPLVTTMALAPKAAKPAESRRKITYDVKALDDEEVRARVERRLDNIALPHRNVELSAATALVDEQVIEVMETECQRKQGGRARYGPISEETYGYIESKRKIYAAMKKTFGKVERQSGNVFETAIQCNKQLKNIADKLTEEI
jgi:hypothetical protein